MWKNNWDWMCLLHSFFVQDFLAKKLWKSEASAGSQRAEKTSLKWKTLSFVSFRDFFWQFRKRRFFLLSLSSSKKLQWTNQTFLKLFYAFASQILALVLDKVFQVRGLIIVLKTKGDSLPIHRGLGIVGR